MGQLFFVRCARKAPAVLAPAGICGHFCILKDKRSQKSGKYAENTGHLTLKKLLFIQCGIIFCHTKVDREVPKEDMK